MTSLLSKTAPNYQTKTGQTNNIYLPQPFLNYAGLTKMLSGNYHYVPKEPENPVEENPSNATSTNVNNNQLDNTLFQQHPFEETKQKEQSSFSKSNTQQQTNQQSNQQANQQANQQQQDGEPQEEDTIGFWINNINTGNVYRSFTKGTNPWARSSAFTQPIQRTRGAFCYYQNAYDSPIGGEAAAAAGISAAELKRREEELQKQQEEAERKAREEAELQERIRGAQIGVGGVRQDTSKKILTGCCKKGWIGLCALKCFLHSNTKNNCDIIDKNSFKLLLKKQGILLEDTDIESICDAYDTNKSDYFNFVLFFNALRNVSNTRGAQIESFKDQVKAPGQNYIVFSNLLALADMNYHPEAIRFLKSVPDLRKEYVSNWDCKKADNKITEDDFRQFFYDVSTCVENDGDFIQILKALGYK